jgi:hypothetical protein
VATGRPPDSEHVARASDWSLLLRACHCDTSELGIAVAQRFPDRRASEWADFLALMDRQGVGSLAASALLSVDADLIPESVRAALQDRVHLGALRAEIQVLELLGILDTLEARGIAAIAYKGQTLSMLAYGRTGVRDSGDLDVLVHESDVTAAEEVLRRRGYRKNSTGVLRPQVEARWPWAYNETEFVSHDGWVFVDLHWRMYPAQYPFRVDPIRLWSRPAQMMLGGREVRVFPAETLVGHLCLHGAKDHWRKLLWLCDIDRVIRVSPAFDWNEVRALAEESHARRAVGLTLLLVHRFFDTPLPKDVLAPLAADETLTRLLARVEGQLATGGIRCPWWLAHFLVFPFHLEVLDSWRDGVVYTGRTLVNPGAWDWDFQKVHLPDFLHWLYFLLRPLRLLATLPREAFRRGRRPQGR